MIIEIPMNADPIEYEVVKDTGALFVDRFMMTTMHDPCNYGYIPHTLSDLLQIQHFFQHYKDLEPGKWVMVIGWVGRTG